MNIFLAILIVLDLITGSMAGGLAYVGSGVGGGGTGSSFLMPMSFNNTDESTAAFGIFQKSCDPDKWPEIPKTKEDFQKVDPALILQNCKKYETKDGKSGIEFVGPADVNAREMTYLRKGFFDRRSVLLTYYLLQRGFTGSGNESLKMNCTNSDGVAAPMMILGVHFDANGTNYINDDGTPSPAALISAKQQPPEGGASKNSVDSISPHAYGQAVDIKSYGCIRIEQQNKPTIVTPVNLAMAQTPVALPAGTSVSQGLASSVDGVSTGDEPIATTPYGQGVIEMGKALPSGQRLDEALNIDPQTINIAGTTDVGGVADIATLSLAKQIAPDMTPEILKTSGDLEQTGEAELANDFGLNLPPAGDQAAKKSFWDRVKEKAQGLAGRQLGVDQQAIDNIKSGNYLAAAKAIGATRLNTQFDLGLNQNDIQVMVSSGKLNISLVTGSPAYKNLSATNQQALLALLNGGQTGLENFIQNQNDLTKINPSFGLVNVLRNNKLSDSDKAALRDFVKTADSVSRDGAMNRAANQDLKNWMTQNKNLPAELSQSASNIYDAYDKNGIKGLDAYAQNFAESFLSENYALALSADQRAQIESVLGQALPNGHALLSTVKSEQFQTAFAGAQVSARLTAAGLDPTQAAQLSNLAVAIYKNKTNPQTTLNQAKDAEINKQISIYTQKWGVTLTKQSFTDPAAREKAINDIAVATLSKRINQNLAGKLQIAGHKIKIPDDIAQKIADKFGIGKSDLQKVAEEDAAACAKCGDDFAAVISGKGLDDKGSTNVSDKMKDYFKDQKQEKKDALVKELQTKYGVNPKDAQDLLDGKIGKTKEIVVTAQLVKTGYVSPDEAYGIAHGTLTTEQKSSISDRFIAQKIGINVDGLTASIIKGQTNKTVDVAKTIGANELAPALTQEAGKLGINISNDQAAKIIKDQNWNDLGTAAKQSEINDAATRASAATGNKLTPDQVKTLYQKAVDKKLTAEDAKSTGWDVFETQTGISKTQVDNLQALAKDPNMISDKAQSYAKNQFDQMKSIVSPDLMKAQIANMSSAIIVNTLIGQKLAEIDPTGGFLAGYASAWLQQSLMAAAVPLWALAAVAFILSPDSFISMIKGNFDMALSMIKNPYAFAMGFISGLLGKKPKVGVPYNAAAQATIAVAGQKSGLAGLATSKAPDMTLNLTKPIAQMDKPKPDTFKSAAVSMQDLIMESLLIFSLAQKNGPKPAVNTFYKNLMGFDPPTTPMTINQLGVPRNFDPKATDIAFSFKGKTPDGSFNASNFLDVAKEIYGTNSGNKYDPAKTSGGRIRAVGYLPQADRVHVGF